MKTPLKPVNSPPFNGIQELLILRDGVAAKVLVIHSEAVLPQPHHHLHLELKPKQSKSLKPFSLVHHNPAEVTVSYVQFSVQLNKRLACQVLVTKALPTCTGTSECVLLLHSVVRQHPSLSQTGIFLLMTTRLTLTISGCVRHLREDNFRLYLRLVNLRFSGVGCVKTALDSSSHEGALSMIRHWNQGPHSVRKAAGVG